MFFFNTLYIQRVLGYHPLKAGLAFLPFTGGIMISAGLASTFAPRVGVRLVAAIGLIVSILGMLLLVRLPVHGSYVRRRPAFDPAHVARDGRRLHAADADRDHRPRRRGPGPRVRPLQHLAAGRRLTRARDPLDPGREPDERLPRRRSRRHSSTASTTRSPAPPVSSWSRSSLMLAMLRERHVARIMAEASSTLPAPG